MTCGTASAAGSAHSHLAAGLADTRRSLPGPDGCPARLPPERPADWARKGGLAIAAIRANDGKQWGVRAIGSTWPWQNAQPGGA